MGFIPFTGSTKTTPEPRTEADVNPDADESGQDAFTTPVIPNSNDTENELEEEEPSQILGINSDNFIAVVGLVTVVTVISAFVCIAICYKIMFKVVR